MWGEKAELSGRVVKIQWMRFLLVSNLSPSKQINFKLIMVASKLAVEED